VGLTFIAVVLLAAAWAAILLPDLRNRSSAPRRTDSVKSFRQQLSGLDRTRPGVTTRSPYGRPVAAASPDAARRPRPAAPARAAGGLGPRAAAPTRSLAPRPMVTPRSAFLPRNRNEAAQRRRLVLALLVATALLTLLGGLVVTGALFILHLLVDAALGVYGYLLWERASRTRARSKFLTLDTVDDDVVLRREATGS
jgi:hypothetical protein